jgi:hypothetical protein
MPLDALQRDIAEILKRRRSTNSFVGGSSVFNETFPRLSDDIDIYAEDVAILDIADRDVLALREAGLSVRVDKQFYGFVVEAVVTRSADDRQGTKLEWTEADRRRFYPIQPHETFGWTLHKADLAVQKLIAAASRRKARDALDILLIDEKYAPLAALAIAAPAKLENASPPGILDQALRNGLEHPIEDYLALRLDVEAMPFAISEIKTRLAARINETLDLLVRDCASADPGFLYLKNPSLVPVAPLDVERAGLSRHGITARGAVPIFSNFTAEC